MNGGWTEHSGRTYGPEFYVTGKYELHEVGGVHMRVDYALDPTVTPGKYGRFHSVFISRLEPSREIEYARIMLGPYIEDPRSDEPMVAMGDFDFSKEDNRNALLELVKSERATVEVVWVLKDVLHLSGNGKLQKICLRQRNREGYAF